MKDEIKKSNIYVDERLSILEKVDKDDNIYYPGDDIVFTVILINNTNEEIPNVLIKDTLPSEVIPFNKDGYVVEVTKGEVSQKKNIILVKIDKVDPKEVVRLIIKGKVGG